jgi:hypothetical protein
MNIENYSWRNGMSTLAIRFDDHAVDVSFTKTSLHFILADGREISAPLEWFPRLRDATDLNEKTGGLLVMVLEYIGLRLMKIFLFAL